MAIVLIFTIFQKPFFDFFVLTLSSFLETEIII